jgi:type II secretory pathway component GspD/PulD (secretin)
MKTNYLNVPHAFWGIVVLCLALAPATQAQQRGGGGFPGFGANQNRGATTTATSQYNNNGTVGGATIYFDPDTKNIVVISDQPTSTQISNVISNLDRPKPQVLIKVVFIQVLHSDATDIGVEGNWGNSFGNSMTNTVANVFGLNGLNTLTTNFNAVPPTAVPALTQASPGAGLYQILGSDFQATLRAIASAGKAELLSRPSILARDGQPATITVGQSVPLITSVTFAGVSAIPVNNVTYTDVGIILKVTPYISPEGYVEMIVSPENSTVSKTDTVPIAAGVNAPVIDQSRADTVVITPDSQTVVIGGLMGSAKSSTVSKIPILGDIPFLGALFRRKTTGDVKTELLIFLTPHIVQAPSQLAALAQHEQNHGLVPKSYSEQELDRFLEKVPLKKD